ncbi:MAG: rod shape-determining protein RodA [Thermodesulfobacteriota bacterium]
MSPFDRRLFSHFNWTLFFVALLLFALGVLNLYSASSLRMETGLTTVYFYKKQLFWGLAGLLGLLIFLSFDYRHLKSLVWPIFWVSVLLLLWILLFEPARYGAKRWISLGFFSLQPTELAKLSVILLTAYFLAKIPGKLSLAGLGKLLGLVLLPCSLIVLQPDLGSSLNILLIFFGMILYKGLQKGVYFWMAAAVPVVAPLGWIFLQDYQRRRILSFLNPETDPLGSGYNILQSQIAIGSGQLWGKGFLEGTQSQLRFLPEKHTDFVLAVFGEEWGFAGCFFLLALFCIFLQQILRVIQESKDSLGSYLCLGIFFYFYWQILINMAMVLGLSPVVGIPLPFLSYGGSSTVLNFCLLGLVLNVSMRRFVFRH